MVDSSDPPHNEFVWHIENYGWYEGGPDIEISSGFFKADRIYCTKWNVLVHPKAGDDDDDRIVVWLQRHEADDGPDVLDIDCRMVVVAYDGKETDQAATMTWTKVEKGTSSGDVILACRSVIFGDKAKYLPSGTLTVRVKLWKIRKYTPPTSETKKTDFKCEKLCLTWTVLDKKKEATVVFGTPAVPELFEMIFRPWVQTTELFPHANNPDVIIPTSVNLADEILHDHNLFARSQNNENRDDDIKNDAGFPLNANSFVGITIAGLSKMLSSAGISIASLSKMLNSNIEFFDPDDKSDVQTDEEDHFNKGISRGVRRFTSVPSDLGGNITIRQKTFPKTLILVDSRISVLDSHNRRTMTAEDSHLFPVVPDHCRTIGQHWFYPDFIDSSKLESQMELRLHCDFVVVDGTMIHSVVSPCSNIPDLGAVLPPPVLEDHVESLYWNEDYADVDLSLEDGGLYAAHKFILAARSTVFRKLIEDIELKKLSKSIQDIQLEEQDNSDDKVRQNTDAGQPKRDVLEVSINPNYIEPFLKFLYTDKLYADDLDCKDLMRLYLYAIDFDVPLLSRECVSLMRTRFDFEWVMIALAVAHFYNDQQLIEYAENYIAEHRLEIMLSDAWEEFVKGYPALVGPTMDMLRSRSENRSLSFYDFEN